MVSIGIFVVRVNKASERHGIGKKDRFGYQFGQKSLYELSRFINNWHSRKESPERSERSNMSSEQITQTVLTLTPPVYTTGFGEDSTKINVRTVL